MYNPSYELSILRAKLSRQRGKPESIRSTNGIFPSFSKNMAQTITFFTSEKSERLFCARISIGSTAARLDRSIDRSSRFYFYDFDISSRVNSARFRRGEKLEKLKGRSKQFANFRDRWDIGRYWSRNSARQL